MAPAEVSETATSYPLSNLKVLNRAMEFPVVSDTVGGVAKYTESIRSNSTVKSATNAVQAGFKSFTDLKPVMAVKDAVLKSSTISDVVMPRMAGAVESLDSMACDRLDHLKAAVPAIAEPTPQLLQSTRNAASGYWSTALEYLSSFTVSQVSLGLADQSLDVMSMVVSKVVPSAAVVGSKPAVKQTKATIFGRLMEIIGGARYVVQDLKKRGEPLASDVSVRLGLFTARLINALRLPAIFGFFGLRLEALEGKEGKEVDIKMSEVSGGAGTMKSSEGFGQQHETGKRSAESESSDDD